jgi:hypothetical protein
LALARRRELGTIEHCEGIAATDLDVIVPAPDRRSEMAVKFSDTFSGFLALPCACGSCGYPATG